MSSSPKELAPYEKAYKLKMRETDALVHAWVGNYGISALGVAISGCFSKRARGKYIENPILKDTELDNQRKLQAQREQFVAGLMAMQANFELGKAKGDKL